MAAAGDVPFLAIDNIIIAIRRYGGGNILGVWRCGTWFRHGKGGLAIAVQQWFQPFFLFFLSGVSLQGDHVGNVGPLAVEHFRGPKNPPQQFSDNGVVQITHGQARLAFRQIRMRHIPQVQWLGLGTQLVKKRRVQLAILLGGTDHLPVPRQDVLLEQLTDLIKDRIGLRRWCQVHDEVPRIRKQGPPLPAGPVS